MLELKDVVRSAFGRSLLAGFSLDVASGRPVAIAGLSEVDRDAFVRLITGEDRPDAGTVRLGGRDVAQARKEKGRVVKVNARGNADAGRRVGKLVTPEIARRAGLSAHLETRLGALAPAQRMMLAVAQAAAARPALLVLEAPAGELDAAGRSAFTAALPDLLEGYTGVLVLVAGSADEAMALQGDLVVLDGGAVVQAGGAAEVSERPAHLASAVATSTPVLNRLELSLRGGRCMLQDGSSLQLPDGLSLPVEGACTLAFRPGDCTLERASPGCVRFVVRAVREETLGGQRYLSATFAGATWLCPLSAATPPAGAVVNAFIDRLRLMVFDAEGRPLA